MMDYGDDDDNENDLLGDVPDLDENELFEDEGDNDARGAIEEAEESTRNDDENPKSPKPIKPKKIVRNPQPKLNFETLQGPKGLKALNKSFENFKFKGDGREKEDLTEVMKLLEQWMYRLFPKFHFEDGLQRLESLGKKKIVQTYLRKLRLDMDQDFVTHSDEEQDAENVAGGENHATDAFDAMLSQEIERNVFTPATAPAPAPATPSLTEEQLRIIELKRQEALNRRLAKRQETENNQE